MATCTRVAVGGQFRPALLRGDDDRRVGEWNRLSQRTGMSGQIAALQAVNIGGEDYLYVAGSSTGALQSYRVDSGGALRAPAGGAPVLAAAGVSDMASQRIGSSDYLFTVSTDSHQIQGFRLTASGGMQMTGSHRRRRRAGHQHPHRCGNRHCWRQDLSGGGGQRHLLAQRARSDGHRRDDRHRSCARRSDQPVPERDLDRHGDP